MGKEHQGLSVGRLRGARAFNIGLLSLAMSCAAIDTPQQRSTFLLRLLPALQPRVAQTASCEAVTISLWHTAQVACDKNHENIRSSVTGAK